MFEMKFVILPSGFTTENVSLAQQWVVRWRVSLWKANMCIWQQLQNYTSLCCVCTVTPVSHERVEPTAGWCLEQTMQPRVWMPCPCSGWWQSHLWPIFQMYFVLSTTVLCLLCSSMAMVGALLPVQPWAGSSWNCSGNGKVSPGTDTRQQLLLFLGWIVGGWALQNWGPQLLIVNK